MRNNFECCSDSYRQSIQDGGPCWRGYVWAAGSPRRWYTATLWSSQCPLHALMLPFRNTRNSKKTFDRRLVKKWFTVLIDIDLIFVMLLLFKCVLLADTPRKLGLYCSKFKRNISRLFLFFRTALYCLEPFSKWWYHSLLSCLRHAGSMAKTIFFECGLFISIIDSVFFQICPEPKLGKVIFGKFYCVILRIRGLKPNFKKNWCWKLKFSELFW